MKCSLLIWFILLLLMPFLLSLILFTVLFRQLFTLSPFFAFTLYHILIIFLCSFLTSFSLFISYTWLLSFPSANYFFSLILCLINSYTTPSSFPCLPFLTSFPCIYIISSPSLIFFSWLYIFLFIYFTASPFSYALLFFLFILLSSSLFFPIPPSFYCIPCFSHNYLGEF